MTSEQLLNEIRDLNLSYLMLAQRMIREDRSAAIFRLGISEELADTIASLSAAQVVKVAATNMVLCRMRFTEDMVWNLLTNVSRDVGLGTMHAAILMADARPAAAAA